MTAVDGWVTGGRVELALRKTLLLQVVQPVSTPVPSFCHHSCHHHCQHLFPSVITLVIITVNTCSLLSSLLSSSLLSFLCHLVKDYLVPSSSKIYVYVKGHICTYKWTFHEVTQSYACEICPVGNNPHKASSRFRAFMS